MGLHPRSARSALATVEPLRHRLRPQDAGPHLRRHEPIATSDFVLRPEPNQGAMEQRDSSDRRSQACSSCIALGAYVVWRTASRAEACAARRPLEQAASIRRSKRQRALYKGLELALALQGIPRPPRLPPLPACRGPRRAGILRWPTPVLELTNRYLEARFGGCRSTRPRSATSSGHQGRSTFKLQVPPPRTGSSDPGAKRALGTRSEEMGVYGVVEIDARPFLAGGTMGASVRHVLVERELPVRRRDRPEAAFPAGIRPRGRASRAGSSR